MGDGAPVKGGGASDVVAMKKKNGWRVTTSATRSG